MERGSYVDRISICEVTFRSSWKSSYSKCQNQENISEVAELCFLLMQTTLFSAAVSLHWACANSNSFLSKLESVPEVIWKAQIKGIKEPKQPDEPHYHPSSVVHDFDAFNHDSHVLWLHISISSDSVYPHLHLVQCPSLHPQWRRPKQPRVLTAPCWLTEEQAINTAPSMLVESHGKAKMTWLT